MYWHHHGANLTARTVRVMFCVEQDPDCTSFPLVLAITYLDVAAMARGLASPGRYG